MKKVLALVLAVVLAFGMASVAFAAPTIEAYPGNNNAKTVGVEDEAIYAGLGWCMRGYNMPNMSHAGSLTDTDKIYPQNEPKLRYYLKADQFEWDSAKGYPYVVDKATVNTDRVAVLGRSGDWVGYIPVDPVTGGGGLAWTYLTKSMLSNIGVTARKTKGYPAMKDIVIKSSGSGVNGEVYVEVTFIKELVSVNEEDFDYDITLTYKKTKQEQSLVQLIGTIMNPIIEVDEDNDTADTMDGSVVHALDFVQGISLFAGSGVTVKTNMFEDCKYYCVASMDLSKSDLDLMEKNVPIEGIITMKTALSKNATLRSATVTMALDDTYYVYDNKELLGISTDTLPFRDKYYLTTSKIDMAGNTTEVVDSGDAAPIDPNNPITGGDSAPANVNDNPGTGVNGFVNVAVVAGVVALAAAGAVCLKK